MDRMEHVVRHGDFRVVATAERARSRATAGEARWEVLVSLWNVDKDPVSAKPEMIRLEDRSSADLGAALSGAVELAKKRIDELGR
jgi:hypothetical protein